MLALVAVALVSGSAPSLAAAPHTGVWVWTEPDVQSIANGVPPKLGPSVAATLIIEGVYSPSADWEAVMSDATVSCRDGSPHYAPTVRGSQFFDTFVLGSCHLGVDPDGHIHAYWNFGVANNGGGTTGPMRGDGYFT